jgi:hypothetical protein
MEESAITITCLRDLHGGSLHFPQTLCIEREHILGIGDVWRRAEIHDDIEEATGNEGATLERQYRMAVIVLWPISIAIALRASLDTPVRCTLFSFSPLPPSPPLPPPFSTVMCTFQSCLSYIFNAKRDSQQTLALTSQLLSRWNENSSTADVVQLIEHLAAADLPAPAVLRLLTHFISGPGVRNKHYEYSFAVALRKACVVCVSRTSVSPSNPAVTRCASCLETQLGTGLDPCRDHCLDYSTSREHHPFAPYVWPFGFAPATAFPVL